MTREVAIGIDLGTTNCCVAAYYEQKFVILPNELGSNTSPSYVSIDANENVTVGRVAKRMAWMDVRNTAYDVKRLIGLPFDDPQVQKDIQNWPFEVTGRTDNIPKIVLQGKEYHPEQVSGMLLAHLKKQAEEYLRCGVTKAVITVPAYFNDGQRQATKHAGTIANLEVLRILNEPTAAAIAFCHQRCPKQKQTNFIFDLGGGTLDVAVLTMDNDNIEIKAIGGDTHLGGEDFDNNMVQYCLSEFKKLHDIDLVKELQSENPIKQEKAWKNYLRLKAECEEQKICLTAAESTKVTIDAFHNGIDAVFPIKRSTFNSINMLLFQKCIEIIDQVLRDAKVNKSNINEVILVGGSSKIPKLREMVKEYFNNKPLCITMNGDEAVAYGAAIQAALLTCKEEIETRHGIITTKDVVPLPIGLQLKKKGTTEVGFRIVIDKNTALPCSEDWICRTYKDGQKGLVVIRQGEHPEVTKNYLLGKFKAENLPRNCVKGTPVKITMAVDAEGILTVTASYEGTEKTNSLVVKALKNRLSQEELVKLIIKDLAPNKKK